MRSESVKINLGSGPHGIEGWINIDSDFRLDIGNSSVLRALVGFLAKTRVIRVPVDLVVKPPPNYKHVNLLKGGLPFTTNSIDYCYSSHFLEHLPRKRAGELMKEAHRVLKHGGKIRVAVPDLDIIVREYLDAKKGDRKAMGFWKDKWPEMKTPLEKFNAEFYKFPRPDLKYEGFGGFSKFLKKTFVPDMGHQWMYDYDDMHDLLKSAGFRNITKSRFGFGTVPDADRLDNREDETMFIEAEK